MKKIIILIMSIFLLNGILGVFDNVKAFCLNNISFKFEFIFLSSPEKPNISLFFEFIFIVGKFFSL